MTRRTTARTTGRPTRTAAPVQSGLWGEDTTIATGPAPAAAHPTNNPEQWARVLGAAASDAGLMVTAGRRGVRRVLARVPGSGVDGGPEHVTAVSPTDAAVVFQALEAGHIALGTGRHQVRHGRYEGPAVRVLVPARTRSLLARWAALLPVTGRAEH